MQVSASRRKYKDVIALCDNVARHRNQGFIGIAARSWNKPVTDSHRTDSVKPSSTPKHRRATQFSELSSVLLWRHLKSRTLITLFRIGIGITFQNHFGDPLVFCPSSVNHRKVQVKKRANGHESPTTADDLESLQTTTPAHIQPSGIFYRTTSKAMGKNQK